jgi:hypothetical protein
MSRTTASFKEMVTFLFEFILSRLVLHLTEMFQSLLIPNCTQICFIVSKLRTQTDRQTDRH